MGKNLNFCIDKLNFNAGIVKLDRDKVYGYVDEIVLDKKGHECSTGNILDDGQTIFLSGSTALKTVTDENIEVDKKTLKTVFMDGSDAILIPSSFDNPIELQKVDFTELFNLEVTTVYQLTLEDSEHKKDFLKLLEDGSIFSFVFNYRADYEGAAAILLSSNNEIFVLTGRKLEFDFLENKNIVTLIEPEVENDEDEEEIDFGML